jgi:hypothetical protein
VDGDRIVEDSDSIPFRLHTVIPNQTINATNR